MLPNDPQIHFQTAPEQATPETILGQAGMAAIGGAQRLAVASEFGRDLGNKLCALSGCTLRVQVGFLEWALHCRALAGACVVSAILGKEMLKRNCRAGGQDADVTHCATK